MSTWNTHKENHRETFVMGCWYCKQMKDGGKAPVAIMEALWTMPEKEIKRRMKEIDDNMSKSKLKVMKNVN